VIGSERWPAHQPNQSVAFLILWKLRMRIGITCDLKSSVPDPTGGTPLPDDWQEEYDDPTTIEAIASVLRGAGHEVRVLGDGPEVLRQLLDSPPDFVFNMAEGHGISRSREARVPAVLEMLGIPHTGSDPLTLAVTLDKSIAKRLVCGCSPSLQVPAGVEIAPGQGCDGHPDFPLIAKPAWEGSSKGIRGTCLVRNQDALDSVVADLHRNHRQPVLLEEYIEGDELTVGVIGNARPQVIGIMRVVPLTTDPAQPFLYSLEVKRDWRRRVRYERPAYHPELIRSIEQAAIASFQALGCRDVCRIDFRFHPQRGLYFLEANPLPGLNAESSDLILLGRLSGWTYERIIERIFDEAVLRTLGIQSSSD
jgi:D-alanine-D-alanine ligase